MMATPVSVASQEAHAGAAHAGGQEHGAGTQTVNFFLGGLDEFGASDGFVLGTDYEYRIVDDWGLGGFMEGVAGSDRSFAAGGQVYWHAVSDLVLVVGVGAERRHADWEPILRTGGFYEFHMGSGLVISPAIYYDFTPSEEVLIYGFNVGRSW